MTGDLLFWVGPDPDRLVPVALLGEQTGRQVERQAVIRAGETVAIFGYVRAVRDATYLNRRMAERPEERARLARAQIYISALRVEHLGRATD